MKRHRTNNLVSQLPGWNPDLDPDYFDEDQTDQNNRVTPKGTHKYCSFSYYNDSRKIESIDAIQKLNNNHFRPGVQALLADSIQEYLCMSKEKRIKKKRIK